MVNLVIKSYVINFVNRTGEITIITIIIIRRIIIIIIIIRIIIFCILQKIIQTFKGKEPKKNFKLSQGVKTP